jgi:hypothetical protein
LMAPAIILIAPLRKMFTLSFSRRITANDDAMIIGSLHSVA